MTIDLLLVDDHEMVRAGLRSLLAGVSEINIVGEAASVAEAVREAERLKPQVVLMDLRLPDGSGIDACRDILSARPQTRILFLTSYSDEEAVLATVMAGACGYLMKEIGQHALIRAITDAAAGRPILDSRSTQPVETKIKNVALSPQERRVLALVVEGKTNKEIAAALYLSDKTVKHYLSNACVKLGVSRRSQAAVIFARQEGKG
ncbi:MAG TPA: response regulator transcription factor [Burkholderiales bacterium]|nr:response regulator transcription factor [Burkholderiales bacterium]